MIRFFQIERLVGASDIRRWLASPARIVLTLLTLFAFVAAPFTGAPRVSRAVDDAINTVTNNNDNGPGSLRQVIANSASGDTISFDPSVAGAIVLTSGEVPITKSLTMIGPGREMLTVNGNSGSRIFFITTGSTVTISGLTIRGGNSPAYGGGVYSAGALTLINSAVLSNTANFGGGIFIESDTGSLTLNSSTIATNTATVGMGGGIALGAGAGGPSSNGTILITNSTIANNSAASRGGGIASTGPITLDTSTVANNTAASGGGIDAGSLAVTASSIVGNKADVPDARRNMSQSDAQVEREIDSILGPLASSATGDGGGIYSTGGVVTLNGTTIASNTAESTGGGIAISGTLAMTNTTISGNSAALLAGAIAHRGGVQNIHYSTIANNSSFFAPAGIAVAGTTTLRSTILANANNSNCAVGATGVMTSAGFNLDSGNTCGLNGASDLANTNPLLGALTNNGGPTLTHALPFGSPAINASVNIGCPATDQRGVSRPQGVRCDIGAYEAFLPKSFLPLVVK